MKLLNAKAKTLQIDEILDERARTEAARAQRMATDSEEKDACLDKEDPQETPPVPDTSAANTRSRAGSGQRTVTQEVLMNVLDISGTGYLLTPRNTASQKFPKKMFSEMAAAVLDGDTGKLMEYRHLMKNPKYKNIWGTSFGNEVGRLAQGMPGRIEKENGNNTMFFVRKGDIPWDRRKDVTYARIVCNYWDQKKDKERTRLCMGGTKLIVLLTVAPPPQSFSPSNFY